MIGHLEAVGFIASRLNSARRASGLSSNFPSQP
jgi:hypothetical protein